ncbi:uncharacterized protein [Chiloscyllium punctatum]|uniref:uncharacterized protein isoform X2 n=1 Tax=Chiloscyllium punctatum TaxID=137246 RepID=UPI003B63464E
MGLQDPSAHPHYQESIQSTQEFLDIIGNIHIDKEETMISFDVTALFTSIDKTLAKETIANLLDRHNRQQNVEPINKDGILKLLDLCLTTHFTFNTQIYEQINGTPMGSPIFGLIAEAVMQRLEQTVFPQIQPKLWVRYVDDTFVIIKNTEIENTHQIINATFTGIRFTREEEKDNQLPFLDVVVQRTPNGEFTTKVYRKATHTDQVLNYESNHPNTHKRSCIRTLFKRATTHCSTPELQKEEEEHLCKVFAKNGYPRNFINKCLRERQRNEDMPQPKGLATLPYIRSISELTARLLRPLGLITAHKPTATLRQQLTRTKDPIPNMIKTNVVYKIPCKDCIKHYIGQTGRQVTIRIHEHQLATKRHDQLSLVATHTDDKQHEFDWDNTTIIGQAKQRTAREFLEAWHSSTDSINKHIDLDPIYRPLQRTARTDNRKRQRQATINGGGNSTEALHRRLPSTEDVT